MGRQCSLFEDQEQAEADSRESARRAADERAERQRQQAAAARRQSMSGVELQGMAREFAHDIASGTLAGANGPRRDGRCSLADVASAMVRGGYAGRVTAELFEDRLWAPFGGEWEHRFAKG